MGQAVVSPARRARLAKDHGREPLGDSLAFTCASTLLEAAGDKQPDWPPQTVITGFPIYDRDGATGLPPALAPLPR